jgi:hypothetical protein
LARKRTKVMGWKIRATGLAAVLAGLTGCAPSDPYAVTTLPKGAQLDIRDVLNMHRGQSACVDYDGATDSCASVISSVIKGNTMVSREIAMVRLPEADAAQRVEIVTRSGLRDGLACAQPQDLRTPGKDEISQFLLEIARDLITQSGGTVCAAYFRAGDGYVLSPTGSDGAPFALGDVAFRFVNGPAKLRVQ